VASISNLNPRRAAAARVAASSARKPLMSGDALVLEGVTRAFGALRAVDDVSLSVAAGQK
jgi:branched-chain amino acid transport system ATP-binding protein